MTDIFREVEEEVRRERYAQLWKQYGDYIIAAALVIVVAVAGWQIWQRYRHGQQADASNAYIMAMQTQDPAKAAAAFAKLAKDAPSGYGALSHLQEANSLFAAGKRDEAMALYRQLMTQKDPMLAAVARLRLAWAGADSLSRDEIAKLLAPLTAPAAAQDGFRYMADEVLAYADYRTGDMAKARAGYEALAKAEAAPAGIKGRAAGMAAFLAAGGNRNVGSVPPPPAPTPAAPTPATAAEANPAP